MKTLFAIAAVAVAFVAQPAAATLTSNNVTSNAPNRGAEWSGTQLSVLASDPQGSSSDRYGDPDLHGSSDLICMRKAGGDPS